MILIIFSILILLIIAIIGGAGYLIFKGAILSFHILSPHKDIVFLAIIMMLGMFGNYPFTIWEKENRDKFSFRKFLRPIFVAPIVFISVWQTTGGGELNLITYLLAYQNGFFWNTVLKASN